MSEELKNEIELSSNSNFPSVDELSMKEIFSKKKKGLNLVSKPLDMGIGETLILAVLGVQHVAESSSADEKGNVTVDPAHDVIVFFDEEGNTFFNRGHQIVKACRNLEPKTAIEITFNSDVKLDKKRTMKDYTISALS